MLVVGFIYKFDTTVVRFSFSPTGEREHTQRGGSTHTGEGTDRGTESHRGGYTAGGTELPPLAAGRQAGRVSLLLGQVSGPHNKNKKEN